MNNENTRTAFGRASLSFVIHHSTVVPVLSLLILLAVELGATGDRTLFDFESGTYARSEAIEGAAAVYPFLRPGMFAVAGSQARSARDSYSVDGFGGRGHREVVISSNDGQPRIFSVRMDGIRASAVDVVQATVQAGRKRLEPLPLRDGVINITVPADSVTTLVAQEPATKPRVYLVVKDVGTLTASDRKWQAALAGYDTVLLPQSLSAAEQDAFQAKRHPVDAFGAAAFVISDSVDRRETASAHHVVMGPVIAIGGHATRMFGLEPGVSRVGGEALVFKSELDPPAAMLDRGLPRACGRRAVLSSGADTNELANLMVWALEPVRGALPQE